MLLRSFHRTAYRYSSPSIESHNEVRLQPTSDHSQRCRNFSITTKPTAKVFEFDEIGGKVHHFTVRPPHRSLEILAQGVTETFLVNPFERLNLLIRDMDFYHEETVKQQYAEYLVPSTYVVGTPEAQKMAEEALHDSHGVASQFLLHLNKELYNLLTYDPDVTHVHSAVDEVFSLKAGVCQDFAHVMIACCRSVGVPARYVSGYLHSPKNSEIRGSDAMHAWVEVPMPSGEWLALDPTNNILANEHHIRVHTGRDYADISPLRGLYLGAPAESMEVEIRVEEVDETAVVEIA